YTAPGWNMGAVLTTYPIESVLAKPIGLDAVLKRIGIALVPAAASAPQPAVTALVAIVPLILAGLLAVRARPAARPPLITLVACTIVALTGFLAWMAVRYTWSHVEWSYLEEPRYFRPVWPAALVGWLWACERLGGTQRRIAWAALAACFV